MTLVQRIADDLKASMKAQDAARTGVLRMAKAALMNREIDKKAPLDDDEAVKVLQTLVRQREDSVFQFRKANRPELVRKEEAEIEVLKSYLPAEASDADIGAAWGPETTCERRFARSVNGSWPASTATRPRTTCGSSSATSAWATSSSSL